MSEKVNVNSESDLKRMLIKINDNFYWQLENGAQTTASMTEVLLYLVLNKLDEIHSEVVYK